MYLGSNGLETASHDMTVEEIHPIHEDCRFIQADIRGAKRLASAVCRRESVVIDDRNVQARGVPPGQKRLMKIGEAEEDGAAVAACANENNTDLAVSTMLSAVLMDSLHFFVSGVSWKSSSLETGGPVDANWLGKRSAAFVERVR